MDTSSLRYKVVTVAALHALLDALDVAREEEGDDRVLDRRFAGLTTEELDHISDAASVLGEVTYRLAHDQSNPKNQKPADQTEVWEENQRRWDANHREP